MLEFALALPVFLLLVLGMVDLGRGFYYQNALANAAREGARHAIVDPTNTTAIASAASASAIGFDSSGSLTTRVITAGGSAGLSRGQPITVTMSYSMTALTPMIAAFIPRGLRVSSSSTMLIESNYQ